MYAPGVLGACHGIRSGQEVDVYAEEGVSGALLRGSVKNLELKKKVFVGQGTCRMDRAEIFKPADPEGVTTDLIFRVFQILHFDLAKFQSTFRG